MLGNFTEFSVINCQKIQKIINYWKTFPITDEPNVTQTSCLLLKIRSWTVTKQKKKLFHYVSSLRFLKREFCLKTLPFHPEELRVLSVVGFDEKKTSFSFCVFQYCVLFGVLSCMKKCMTCFFIPFRKIPEYILQWSSQNYAT